MRFSTFFTLALLASLLVGCTPDTAPLNPTAELDFRSSDDCQPYADLVGTAPTCEDFSTCADLAGKRPIRFTLGPTPLTLTGQEPIPPQIEEDLCSDPFGGHPFSFLFDAVNGNPAAVFVFPQLGRLQLQINSTCYRPYLDPETTGPIPFSLPGYNYPEDAEDFPYHLYPVCNDITGDYTFVAANGDAIRFSIVADAFPDCDDPELYSLVGKWYVTGGTGRFDGATGGGCLTGFGPANPFDPTPVVVNKWFAEGGIDY